MRLLKRLINKFLVLLGYQVSRVNLGFPILTISDFLSDKKNRKIFVDVGAHYGETVHSLLKMDDDARIFSFEPNLSSFQKLEKRYDNIFRVNCINMALGDSEGEIEMLDYEGMDAINSFSKINTSNSSKWELSYRTISKSSVTMTTLDEFCKKSDIKTIDLLKIDVQGYELEVLKGAINLIESGSIDLIYVELMPLPLYEEQPTATEVISWLYNFGFQLVGINDVYSFNNGAIRQFDALFKLEKNG